MNKVNMCHTAILNQIFILNYFQPADYTCQNIFIWPCILEYILILPPGNNFFLFYLNLLTLIISTFYQTQKDDKILIVKKKFSQVQMFEHTDMTTLFWDIKNAIKMNTH